MDVSLRSALERRHEEVLERIADAARRSGRAPDDVLLVAISKTFGIDVVLTAIEAGISDLGENRAQEFKQKVAMLGDQARWHFVGYLQTNKARDVVGAATLIHSVDRYGLAEAIGARATRAGIVQDVLVECNVSGERSKHGVEPGQTVPLAEAIATIEGIRVCGLMTMTPLQADPQQTRSIFAGLRELRDRLALVLPGATDLSMGMTRDFEVAIEEGATIVRIGVAIFGPR